MMEEKAKKYEKIGRVTSASVFKGTRKSWDEWIAILDKAGARSWTHREIVVYLEKKHKLGPWWQQGVVLGFELAIGRRQEGQDLKGRYTVTTTKSLPIDAKEGWKLLVSEPGQATWLQPMYELPMQAKSIFETEDGYFGEIRTIQKGRRMRLSWSYPDWAFKTAVEILVVARPKGKSILVFNHGQIPDAKIRACLRVRWKKAVAEFFSLIPPSRASLKRLSACADSASDI